MLVTNRTTNKVLDYPIVNETDRKEIELESLNNRSYSPSVRKVLEDCEDAIHQSKAKR